MGPLGAGSVATYSADGRLIFTGDGHRVAMWDLTHPSEPIRVATLIGASAEIDQITVSADSGLLVATSSRSGADNPEISYAMWDLRALTTMVTDPLGYACGIVGHGLTREEWDNHAPDLAFTQTCDA
ncbi:hypothetical protein [Phytohabitans houttuyneae]|uniref:Anaphase-promoting complex subunit 4 WD40 domain-containing protein n=1 Tax=Phytohabitans houttuyneae TaxID=1076126 RepID=A0A6V8KG09_9ACTN|nr:hypothetical protein [Phytohabitans houttuyneae]GFJ81019.1 hypothetical protein Phou_051990 [Phytohabitans houttuyneae]